MKSYKFVSYDREYRNWDVYDSVTLIEEENRSDSIWKGFDPIKQKLFTGDVYEYEGSKVTLLHSSIRSMPIIPGVLVLDTNQVYGKHKDKYLYKCIPDDRRLPSFLVPYYKRIEFVKKTTNKYIVFKHNHWLDKHPQGTIVNVLGDVEELESFYEYQLYCKSLYASIQQFTKATMAKLKDNTEREYLQTMIRKYNLTDRTNDYVFTIDSAKTTDYDDALSVTILNEENSTYRVSIYIANVSMWMEELSLWESFSERIATIYLPDRKRPMLPTILSECMCSLCEGSIRIALCLDLVIMNNEILSYDFKNTYVNVKENYSYESDKLDSKSDYVLLLKVMQNLARNPYYSYTTELKSSYDVVTYTMILMNYYTACEMVNYKNGIYRSVTINKNVVIPSHLPSSISGFLSHWHSSSGQYQIYDDKEMHDFLKLDNYVHITSPIRRLIDLLNMSILQNNLNIQGKPTSLAYQHFLNKWLSRIDYINTTVRSIRKIQNDSNLLKHCLTGEQHKDDMVYEGYVFDKIKRNDGLFQYVVYLSSIKLVSRITIRLDFDEYCIQHFNILIFNDESSLKKKIRLAHIEEKTKL